MYNKRLDDYFALSFTVSVRSYLFVLLLKFRSVLEGLNRGDVTVMSTCQVSSGLLITEIIIILDISSHA